MIDVTKVCSESKGPCFRVYNNWSFVQQFRDVKGALILAEALAIDTDQSVRRGPGVY